ncbi:MAG TPA: hypothetical protein PLK12_05170 [Prolixibacteraceae bacterium]|nr:hypothetical protein [Prolixibacteraceae bacterium]
MIRIRTKVFFFIAGLFLGGCAMPYRAMDPKEIFLGKEPGDNHSGISISCFDTDLVSPRNKWLAKKLWREEMVFVPVKVENKTELPLILSEQTLEFINDYTPVEMLESSRYLNVFNQKLWPSYLLLPVALIASYYTETVEPPAGEGVAVRSGFRLNIWSGAIALWGIINTTRTLVVNRKMRKDIQQNDLYLKTVLPGSTAYGFICIKAGKLNNPMVRIRDHKPK